MTLSKTFLKGGNLEAITSSIRFIQSINGLSVNDQLVSLNISWNEMKTRRSLTNISILAQNLPKLASDWQANCDTEMSPYTFSVSGILSCKMAVATSSFMASRHKVSSFTKHLLSTLHSRGPKIPSVEIFKKMLGYNNSRSLRVICPHRHFSFPSQE